MLRMRRYATGLAAVLLLAQPVALAPIGANAPTYTIEDLGTMNGLVPTVTGVNASGQVSGFVIDQHGQPGGPFRRSGRLVVRARTRVAAERRSGHQHLRRSDRLCRHVRRRLARLSLHRDDRRARFHRSRWAPARTRGHRHQRVGRRDRLSAILAIPRMGPGRFAPRPDCPAQKLPNLNGDAGHRVRHQRRRAGRRSGRRPAAGVQHTIVVDADGTVHDFAGLNGSSTSRAMPSTTQDASSDRPRSTPTASRNTRSSQQRLADGSGQLRIVAEQRRRDRRRDDGRLLHAGRRRLDARVRAHGRGRHGRSEHAYSERLRLDAHEGTRESARRDGSSVRASSTASRTCFG